MGFFLPKGKRIYRLGFKLVHHWSAKQHALTLNLECLVVFSDEAVEGRDFEPRGGGDTWRGGGDKERLSRESEDSRIGEDGVDIVGNAVVALDAEGDE